MFLPCPKLTQIILRDNELTQVKFMNRGACFRWSFGPLTAWRIIESTTILTTHPSLLWAAQWPASVLKWPIGLVQSYVNSNFWWNFDFVLKNSFTWTNLYLILEPSFSPKISNCRMSDFSDRFSRGAIIVVNHRLKAPRRNRQINLRISFYFFSLLLWNLLEVAVEIFILEYFWAWRKIFGGGEKEKKIVVAPIRHPSG